MANKFWVGGNGTWSGTNTVNWSLTSGGAGGAAVPGTADVAIFDTNSNVAGGGGNYTVTRTATTAVTGLQISNPSAGVATFSGSAAISIAGTGLTISTSTVNMTYTGTMTFTATSTINCNGCALANPVTLNGAGANFTFSTNVNINNQLTITTGTTALSAGVTLGVYALTATGATVRTIAFGTSAVISVPSSLSFPTPWNTGSGVLFSGVPTVWFYGGNGATITQAGTGGTVWPTFVLKNGVGSLTTFSSGSYTGSIDWSINNSGALQLGGVTVRGNLTLNSGTTVQTSASTLTFLGATTNATQTITSAGVVFNLPVSFNTSAGTLALADNLTINAALINPSSGTINVNSKVLTFTNFLVSSSGLLPKFALGTNGSIVLTGTFWDNSTATVSFTGTGTITMSSASAKTLTGNGSTFPTLINSGAGALSIVDANTFADIQSTTSANTITLPSGLTTTVTNFTLSGASGRIVTLNASTAGSQALLSKASGTVNASFLTIKDSAATGGATWNALTTNGNTDSGNNTGWNFGTPSAITGAAFLCFFQ